MTARASGRSSRRKPRAEWLALEARRARRLCRLGAGGGDPQDGERQHPDEPASRRAQARRCAARGPRPLPALRPQADRPLHAARSTTSRATPATVACSTTASRAASPSADCGSTTPSRRRCSRSSSPARSQRRSRPRRRQPRGAIRSARRSLRDLEAARYAADRAFRQYDAADPDEPAGGGGTGGALEQGARRASPRSRRRSPSMTRQRRALGADAARPSRPWPMICKAVWSAPTTDARLKKRIVRTVIHEVVADIDADAAEIVLLIHWMGGVHTELRLPRRRRGQRNSTSPDIVAAVRQLVLIANDDLIAGILNRNKLTTGHGNRWTRERVTSLRSHHKIPVYRPADDGIEPWLNLTKAAAHLGISAKTLRLAAESGEIEALHPLSDGPWIFSRAMLDGPAAHALVERARQNGQTPRGTASRSAKPLLFNGIDRWVL